MSELDSYDLPFATDNAELLSGGSRSRGYKIDCWIVRVPTKEEFLLEQQREASISNLLHQELPEKFVLHSFSGSPEFAVEVSRRGGYVSFGLSLFRHKRAAKLVQSVPQEQILLETDGPWQPLPSEDTSRPEQLPQLAQYIAALRGEDTDDFTAAVYHNSEEFINVRK